MPQVKTITSIVAAKGIVTEEDATAEFWRRMAAANGGRPGKPEEYARIVSIAQEQRGFVIRYEARMDVPHHEAPTEQEERGILLGRLLYEEFSKKGYDDDELKTAGAWLHDLARDHARQQEVR